MALALLLHQLLPAHAAQRLGGPLPEPIDGATIHQGGEHAQPRPEGVPDGRERQHHADALLRFGVHTVVTLTPPKGPTLRGNPQEGEERGTLALLGQHQRGQIGAKTHICSAKRGRDILWGDTAIPSYLDFPKSLRFWDPKQITGNQRFSGPRWLESAMASSVSSRTAGGTVFSPQKCVCPDIPSHNDFRLESKALTDTAPDSAEAATSSLNSQHTALSAESGPILGQRRLD